MHKLGVTFIISEACFHTPGLKVGTVTTRGYFTISFLTGQPYFYVVGFTGGKTGIATTQSYHAIWQLKLLQNGLCMTDQFFKRIP